MSDQVEQKPADHKEDWMNAKWRPMMGWMYMLVCTCDFVIFPVLWALYHVMFHTGQTSQWQPLTLQGAGLFHMAMGAIIGVAAFGRTQEKIAGANNGGFGGGFGGGSSSSSTTFTSTPVFNNTPPAQPTPAPSFGGRPAPAPSFGNKPSAPPRAEMPEL